MLSKLHHIFAAIQVVRCLPLIEMPYLYNSVEKKRFLKLMAFFSKDNNDEHQHKQYYPFYSQSEIRECEDQRTQFVKTWNTVMRRVDAGVTSSRPFRIFELRNTYPLISKLANLIQVKKGFIHVFSSTLAE